MTVDDTNKMHDECMKFLWEAKETAAKKSAKLIVITHHAPLNKGTSAPIYEDPFRKLSRGFSTDLSNFISEHDEDHALVNAWIFGHTHWSCDFVFDEKTKIISNQLGYIGIDCQDKPYRNNVVLDI